VENSVSIGTATSHIDCPYCGERFEIILDPSELYQEYVEDCYVCCRPIYLSVSVTPADAQTDAQIAVVARDENEC